MLNKDGGYYGCLYFTTILIDENSIPGKSIVDKGTDAGGAVELYSSLEDAKKRCEYLASFDGTILSTGSYVLIGTMVIRTSFELDDNEQYQLTDSIIKAMTTSIVIRTKTRCLRNRNTDSGLNYVYINSAFTSSLAR